VGGAVRWGTGLGPREGVSVAQRLVGQTKMPVALYTGRRNGGRIYRPSHKTLHRIGGDDGEAVIKGNSKDSEESG
jgi:hypothetical protein